MVKYFSQLLYNFQYSIYPDLTEYKYSIYPDLTEYKYTI